jgi:hypothetical protein
MMKKQLNILLILAVIAVSCTEKIDIELDETYTRLVVYGAITTDPGPHYIDLSATTSYYYNEAPPAVTGATLEISDGEGNSVSLTETSPGRYATPGLFVALPGRTYTLDINLQEEINGHKYYTATSPVYPIDAIDSIGLVFQPDWGDSGFYEVTCFYQDPPTKDYYMFNILKNGRLLTDTISSIFVSSDEFYNGGYTSGIGVGYLDQSKEDETVNAGDTITFQGCKITEDYYNFVVALQQETGFSTPLFSGPPANVKGNVSNGAVGFFTAYSTSYSSTVYQE